MHQPTPQKARRSRRNGMKWALLWAAVAVIAAPIVGSFVQKHGR